MTDQTIYNTDVEGGFEQAVASIRTALGNEAPALASDAVWSEMELIVRDWMDDFFRPIRKATEPRHIHQHLFYARKQGFFVMMQDAKARDALLAVASKHGVA